MRIDSIRIQNFRSFKDETVRFNSYNCLVGANGSGKSTILCALNVFFRETDNATTNLVSLDIEDFHHKETAEPIEITVTFADLGEDAKQDFANYVRQEKLIVSAIATFDPGTNRAEVKQYGQRMGMADFREFFRALGDGKKVSELREIYVQIRGKYSDLPEPGTKDAMTDALRAYETARQEQSILMPSEDQFYGVSKGANRLAKYLQWIYVPAVKDASSEQVEARNSALGKLLARTVRAKTNFDERIKTLRADIQGQYQRLLDENQEVLEDISASLQGRISEWAHPEATLKLEWRQDPEKSVQVQEPWAHIIAGEGDFEGALARFGHGLQRSYLLALLQELAGNAESSAPTLILGCEEPELYQHPPQARHLSEVLQKLATANSQVIISTHSPLFVSGEGFEDVRMIRRDRALKRSTVTQVTFDEIATKIAAITGESPKKREGMQAKIHQALQPALSEMFFVSRLVLVEGLEDVAYITTYLNLLGMWDEYRKMGCHIVPVNGKSELLQAIVVTRQLGIPIFVVVDSDADKPDRNGSRAKHEKDNKELLSAFGRSGESPMPAATLWGDGFVMWQSDIGAITRDEIGEAEWSTFQQEADKLYGQAGNLRKNGLHIASSLLLAKDAGKKSPSLERLVSQIIDQKSYV